MTRFLKIRSSVAKAVLFWSAPSFIFPLAHSAQQFFFAISFKSFIKDSKKSKLFNQECLPTASAKKSPAAQHCSGVDETSCLVKCAPLYSTQGGEESLFLSSD